MGHQSSEALLGRWLEQDLAAFDRGHVGALDEDGNDEVHHSGVAHVEGRPFLPERVFGVPAAVLPTRLSAFRRRADQLAHRAHHFFRERALGARAARLHQPDRDACQMPGPYEAIIVHSLSRFFRDALEFGWHERELNKAGVRLISITQQTSDDPSGEMARKLFSLFDEYQSKENAKHTLRAMQENARQGYFNGSTPPFGFKKEAVEGRGNKGSKKRLIIDPPEAGIVKKMF